MTGSLQIKNGTFYAVLNFKDRNNQRKQKWINLHLPERGNRRNAEAALNDLLVQYQGFDDIKPMNMLLSQHIDRWLEINRPRIAVTTYDQYVNILHKHIAPYFD